MENEIMELLNEEIKSTLKDVSQAESGSAEAKTALLKLDKLHQRRVEELKMELENNKRNDADCAKRDELAIREKELNIRTRQLDQTDRELDAKLNQITNELELKRAELTQKDAELQEAKKSRRWKTLLDILGISAPLLMTAHWMRKGLKFEEEGKIYSSRTSQWIGGLSRLFKKG